MNTEKISESHVFSVRNIKQSNLHFSGARLRPMMIDDILLDNFAGYPINLEQVDQYNGHAHVSERVLLAICRDFHVCGHFYIFEVNFRWKSIVLCLCVWTVFNTNLPWITLKLWSMHQIHLHTNQMKIATTTNSVSHSLTRAHQLML